LRNLAFRNGVPLRPDPDFDTDVSRLLKGLTTPGRDGPGWLRSRPARVAMLTGGGLAAAALFVLLIVALMGSDDPPVDADDAAQTTLAATTEGSASSATTAPATTAPLTSSAPPTVATTTELPATSVTPALTTVAIAPPPLTTPRGPPIVQSVSASVVRSNGTDSCGNPTQYQPANVHDGQNSTAWMAPGDGVGATLTFDLGQPSTVTAVGLIPGYDKFDPCTGSDRFFDLRRVTRVLWGFDDGTSAEQVLVPEPTMQYLDLRRYVTTSRVTMTILETSEPGDSRLDYTPISEAEVL
jgi:hypothetical protein